MRAYLEPGPCFYRITSDKDYNGVFRGTAKFSEEIINKNIMTQFNINLLLVLSIMYFVVVLNMPMDYIENIFFRRSVE